MRKQNEKIKLLAIAGSLRAGSYNRKLLKIAVRFAKEAGAQVETVDLKEPEIPMYDGDVEAQGFPQSVQRLRKKIASCDGLLLASPEYNFSVSGPMKNAIDWASRDPNVLDGKAVAIFGASNGGFGTVRGQIHLREVLVGLNVWVIPMPQVHVSRAQDAFDEKGNLKDERTNQKLKELVNRLVKAVPHLKKA